MSKKENRGGARKGTGPKPISKKYSDALKKEVFEGLKKKAKETGKTFGDMLATLAYEDSKPGEGTRAVALKMIQDILVIKETQSTNDINVAKSEGPVIGLPPIKKTIPVEKQEKEGVALH